ncbi:MAG TPA: ribonuclease P protein component [Acidimicrobiales bacterium]|nr:ribonuclease P protein component [Acidimicrobiales bacterium]
MTRPAVGRIRERSTFRALSRPVGRAGRGPVRASFVPPADGRPATFPQVGYAISRQHGSAVVRNRLRRRLRAAVRQAAPVTPAGSYLLRPVPGTAELGFPELTRAVEQALLAAASAAGVPPVVAISGEAAPVTPAGPGEATSGGAAGPDGPVTGSQR